jgi:hypothetical protein
MKELRFNKLTCCSTENLASVSLRGNANARRPTVYKIGISYIWRFATFRERPRCVRRACEHRKRGQLLRNFFKGGMRPWPLFGRNGCLQTPDVPEHGISRTSSGIKYETITNSKKFTVRFWDRFSRCKYPMIGQITALRIKLTPADFQYGFKSFAPEWRNAFSIGRF